MSNYTKVASNILILWQPPSCAQYSQSHQMVTDPNQGKIGSVVCLILYSLYRTFHQSTIVQLKIMKLVNLLLADTGRV